MMPDPAAVRRVLVMRLDLLGDLVLTLPAFRALRRHFLNADITLAVPRNLADLPGLDAVADRVVPCPSISPTGWHSTRGRKAGHDRIIPAHRPFSFWMETALWWRRTFRGPYDVAVNLVTRSDPASAWLLGLTPARRRAGYGVGWQRLTADIKVPPPPRLAPEAELALRVATALGAVGDPADRAIPVPIAAAATVGAWLGERGIAPGALVVGLHPGVTGALPQKAWPLERFVEVGRWVTERWGARVVVTGVESERPLVEQAVAQIPGAISACNVFSLQEFTALLARETVLMVNNTGPMHLAAAVGTSTVVLTGFSDPERWGPFGDRHRLVRLSLDCMPCRTQGVACDFGDYRCLQWLAASQAAAAADDLLAALGRRPVGSEGA